MRLFDWLSKRLIDFIGDRALGDPVYTAPIYCPRCHAQHVDEGVFAVRPHFRHLCAYCKFVWRIEPYVFGSGEPGAHDPLERAFKDAISDEEAE